MLRPHRPELQNVTFDRHELRDILNLYGRKVAAGEWRDYAIDFLPDRAVFSIFRRAAEYPLYRVVKDPKLSGKQGAFSVVTTTGLVLKRGSDLKRGAGRSRPEAEARPCLTSGAKKPRPRPRLCDVCGRVQSRVEPVRRSTARKMLMKSR